MEEIVGEFDSLKPIRRVKRQPSKKKLLEDL